MATRKRKTHAKKTTHTRRKKRAPAKKSWWRRICSMQFSNARKTDQIKNSGNEGDRRTWGPVELIGEDNANCGENRSNQDSQSHHFIEMMCEISRDCRWNCQHGNDQYCPDNLDE